MSDRSGKPGNIDVVFFFQAEDGIRDLTVTGVQTCALPIFASRTGRGRRARGDRACTRMERARAREPVRGRVCVTELTYRESVIRALGEELERDDRVLVLGEDVGAAGGVFQATAGLFDRFGPRRIRDTPISEQAIVGCALGASVTGLRPVAEIIFADFAGD